LKGRECGIRNRLTNLTPTKSGGVKKASGNYPEGGGKKRGLPISKGNGRKKMDERKEQQGRLAAKGAQKNHYTPWRRRKKERDMSSKIRKIDVEKNLAG